MREGFTGGVEKPPPFSTPSASTSTPPERISMALPTIRTKGSLCSGTGALDMATPGSLAWVAETADGPSRVLKRDHPEVPNLGDITAPDFDPPYVDLLTSGDPCQSMSHAGQRRASDDERFLWPYVIEVVRRVRPAEVFFENVSGVTTVPLVPGGPRPGAGSRGSVLRLRLDDLRAAGYDCRWMVFGACAVGAPHCRHRWFLRGRYVGDGAPPAVRIPWKCTKGASLLPTPRAVDGKSGQQTLINGRTLGDRGPRLGDIGARLRVTAGRPRMPYGRSTHGRGHLSHLPHTILFAWHRGALAGRMMAWHCGARTAYFRLMDEPDSPICPMCVFRAGGR